MKKLTLYIKESSEYSYKINTWMHSKPEEQKLWDNACKSWKETRQIDDVAIQDFMNGTDVRGFVDFMNDNINDNNIHSDDFDVIKKIIMNYE